MGTLGVTFGRDMWYSISKESMTRDMSLMCPFFFISMRKTWVPHCICITLLLDIEYQVCTTCGTLRVRSMVPSLV